LSELSLIAQKGAILNIRFAALLGDAGCTAYCFSLSEVQSINEFIRTLFFAARRRRVRTRCRQRWLPSKL